MTQLVSVLIPAHNEAGYIAACLDALFASDPLPNGMSGEVLVLANGCTDNTAEIARSISPAAGWIMQVLEIAEGGKLNALNTGDATAKGDVLIYLDADVVVEPALIQQIATALAGDGPLYGSGRPVVAPARTPLTRAYGRFWQKLPFVSQGVPGFGLFAMNRAGRLRWGNWPDIISDDTFARLSFSPSERISLPARYHWPMVEGLENLVRVRRRQNIGVCEIEETFPQLLKNDEKMPVGVAGLLKLAGCDPLGFGAYALVSLLVKTPMYSSRSRWARGR
ncbi:glycosyltransferase family 2 protein [Parasedimentitalea maritima]|uniref:Glycosyltransferase n=1 Tax=Parasedimentitalea maritima TaxID=2578117 RepID=A0A6A4RLI5_9RHOB|nr:glycosyltransferase [Zongyanglinia marina]KAE9630576.1 glycosyltransferase [Zongyanglinia marina]